MAGLQDDGLLSLFDRATWVAADGDEAGAGSGEGREEKAETFVAQARLLLDGLEVIWRRRVFRVPLCHAITALPHL